MISNKSFIPVNEPLLDGNEKKYLLEAVETGWISSEGPFVEKFERKFSEITNRKHGIAVANGTAALEIAVKALDIGPGDEVIIPTFTIISCAGAVIKTGAMPVLIDCDPVTWNMDTDKIEKRISDRTRAIMVVHIYGLPVNIEPVLKLAEKYNLLVIEDAAEMHGQTYHNKPCGSFGDVSIFSFYPNKHITTGEGGMLVCDREELADRCRLLRNLCFKPEQRFVHDELGWNYRMTNLQAALGLAQLEQLPLHIQRKREMGRLYTKRLKDIPGIQLPLLRMDYADNIYWVYGIVLSEEIGFDAKVARNKLREFGIGTRPFFWPMHEQPVFKHMGLFINESYPKAEKIARQGFYLPSGLTITEAQIDRVAGAVRSILE